MPMTPHIKAHLSAREVVASERFADSQGKHTGKALALYERLLEHGSWLLVQVPVMRLNTMFDDAEHKPSRQSLRLIKGYRERPATSAPPVRIHFGAFAARRGRRDAFVANGNHRVLAARMRGDESIEAVMPEADYLRWLEVFDA